VTWGVRVNRRTSQWPSAHGPPGPWASPWACAHGSTGTRCVRPPILGRWCACLPHARRHARPHARTPARKRAYARAQIPAPKRHLLALHDPQLPAVPRVTGRPDTDRHADVGAILARGLRVQLARLLLATLAAHIQLPWGPARALAGAVAAAVCNDHACLRSPRACLASGPAEPSCNEGLLSMHPIGVGLGECPCGHWRQWCPEKLRTPPARALSL